MLCEGKTPSKYQSRGCSQSQSPSKMFVRMCSDGLLARHDVNPSKIPPEFILMNHQSIKNCLSKLRPLSQKVSFN